MKKQIILLVLFLFSAIIATNAQSIGVNTTTPDASAALDVTSTTQWMLVPRMMQSQKKLIAPPPTPKIYSQTKTSPMNNYNLNTINNK